MTPHRSGGRGSLVLARTFPGVRRIHRGSGTTDPMVLQEIQALLTRCWKKGRLDLLQAIAAPQGAAGRLHPLALLEQSYRMPVEDIPAPDVLPLISEVYETWADGYDAGASHRRNLKSAFRGLLEVGGEAIRVGDLPDVLRRLKRVKAKHPAMVNRTKAAVQAYLSDTLGSDHPVYRAVSAVKQLQEKPHRRKRPSMLPDAFAEKVRQLEQPHAGMAWTLALTGMEPKLVYIEEASYEILKDRVHIIGQKTRRRDERRERDVPKVGVLVSAGCGYRPFREALATIGLKPYDLRHLYGQWLYLAGVPYVDLQRYMGHQAQTMTDHYTQHEIRRALVEHARKLERFLGKAQRMMGVA